MHLHFLAITITHRFTSIPQPHQSPLQVLVKFLWQIDVENLNVQQHLQLLQERVLLATLYAPNGSQLLSLQSRVDAFCDCPLMHPSIDLVLSCVATYTWRITNCRSWVSPGSAINWATGRCVQIWGPLKFFFLPSVHCLVENQWKPADVIKKCMLKDKK